jgi:hypothetical protein
MIVFLALPWQAPVQSNLAWPLHLPEQSMVSRHFGRVVDMRIMTLPRADESLPVTLTTAAWTFITGFNST